MGEVVYGKFSQLKQLREQTKMSLDDCKTALVETNWDLNLATDLLLARNRDKAQSKSDRVASEGKIATYNHLGRISAMVEINCETDFAAKTKEFEDFCELVLMQIVGTNPIVLTPDDLSEEDMSRQAVALKAQGIQGEEEFEKAFEAWYDEVCLLRQHHVNTFINNKTVDELRLELAAKLGENVVIKRFVRWEK